MIFATKTKLDHTTFINTLTACADDPEKLAKCAGSTSDPVEGENCRLPQSMKINGENVLISEMTKTENKTAKALFSKFIDEI